MSEEWYGRAVVVSAVSVEDQRAYQYSRGSLCINLQKWIILLWKVY